MKRINNLWEEFTSQEHWFEARKRALRGKVKKYCVKAIMRKGDEYLEKICQDVINGSFQFKGYKEHTIYEPKERKIFVARIEERIYHWASMMITERIFEPTFIFDSYCCRKNKGQHKCSDKCKEIVKHNNYCLKLDISKFYPNINHKILKECLARKIKDIKFLNALYAIIDSHNKDTGKGIPIGNYSSQIFGNIYMTKLDMFVKHTLKCKHYLRYCDDFCLFSNDKKYLNWCKEKIIEFVTNELDMKLSKCDLFKTKQGVDFVGYRHFPQYTLVRKRTAKKVKKRMLKIQYKLKNYELTQKELFKMNGQVASSYGWCKHADSYRFMKKYKIEECLKEIIMRYAEFKNKLHTNKMLSMKINDFINKEITIIGWEYYKKNDNDEDDKNKEAVKTVKIHLIYNGEEKIIITKASVIIRDLEEISQLEKEKNTKIFPFDATLKKDTKRNYFYFE